MERVKINEHNLGCLMAWYSLFTTIMDAPESEVSNAHKLKLLYKLRSRIKLEAPDLETLLDS